MKRRIQIIQDTTIYSRSEIQALLHPTPFLDGFLSQKRSGGGRGVKEKDKVVKVVLPAVTDVPVVKEKQDTSVDTGTPNVDNTGLKSYPPLPTQVNDKYKAGKGYHAVPLPYTGNFMPPKPILVLADEEDYDANETEFKSKQRKPSFAKVDFVKSNKQNSSKAAILVTTASALITTTGVSVSIAEPSTPPTTTTIIEDEDLTIAQTLIMMRTMMEADYELAQRLQAEEQGELTIEERSRLFVELMDKRKKHFAKLRAEKIKRKPPTKAQKRNKMSTYLRNMAGYKHTQLKNKSFEEIQMLFDKEMKRVNSFVPMDSEVVEGSGKKTESSGKETVSKKREGEEHDEESVKRYLKFLFTMPGRKKVYEGGTQEDGFVGRESFTGRMLVLLKLLLLNMEVTAAGYISTVGEV
ncbi:hypothetical protein Tco_0862874 [Tanacetum coccineum]